MNNTYVDASDAHSAASRLESAAKEANEAAYRMEEAVRQFKQLTEYGYGNNFCEMLEMLRKLENKPQ